MGTDAHRAAAAAEGPISVGVVTVSDTRTPDDDPNGRWLAERIEAAGAVTAGYRVVRDEPDEVRAAVDDLVATARVVIVNGGTQAGVQIGQEYFVRRQFQFGRPPSSQPQTVRTAGWLRIVAVNDTTAIAQLDMACDGVRAGDYLEPFTLPVVPAPATTPV